jgi:hypothetical protein
MRLSKELLALLLLASCGGGKSDPTALADAGTKAMNSGNYAAAKADFAKGLELVGSDTAHAEFMRLSLGAIEAEVHINPERAWLDFETLNKQHSDKLDSRDYSGIASRFDSARAYKEAGRVVDLGLKRFAGDEILSKQMDSLKKRAEEDEGLRSELGGLGYLGDG